jgi:hypothetical protein
MQRQNLTGPQAGGAGVWPRAKKPSADGQRRILSPPTSQYGRDSPFPHSRKTPGAASAPFPAFGGARCRGYEMNAGHRDPARTSSGGGADGSIGAAPRAESHATSRAALRVQGLPAAKCSSL